MNALTIRKPMSNETSCESIRIEGPAIGRRDLAHEPVVQLWMLYTSKFQLLEASRHQAPMTRFAEPHHCVMTSRPL